MQTFCEQHGNKPVGVPASIGPGQMRVALRRLHGVTSAQLSGIVAQIIAGITDDNARADAQDLWDHSGIIERNHPLVLVVSRVLGLTSDQVDELFRQAVLV